MNNSHLVVFDADSMIFLVAWKFKERGSKKMVAMAANQFIKDVLKNTGATHYMGFYGSQEEDAQPNFRFDIDPNYKGTRQETPDYIKKWRPEIHRVFNENHGFLPVDGMEADDATTIAVTQNQGKYDKITLVTADKDMLQMPDINYYHMVEHSQTEIDKWRAAQAFARQLLGGEMSPLPL